MGETMKRYFRDKEVIGWVIKEATSEKVLCYILNSLMDDYEIIDCQYSAIYKNSYTLYSALVLIAKKVKK